MHASLDDFRAADSRRSASEHVELGRFWRAADGPAYAAGWVRETGELYLVSHDTGRVRRVGAPMDACELERRLDGWDRVVGQRASVEWLLAQAARRMKRAPASGMKSSAWTRSPSSLKRTFARPLGQHRLSPAT